MKSTPRPASFDARTFALVPNGKGGQQVAEVLPLTHANGAPIADDGSLRVRRWNATRVGEVTGAFDKRPTKVPKAHLLGTPPKADRRMVEIAGVIAREIAAWEAEHPFTAEAS